MQHQKNVSLLTITEHPNIQNGTETSNYDNTGHRMIPPPSIRQHPSYGDCLEVKREYYQNSCVLDCVTQCSQSAAHLREQFLQVKQIGFVTLGPLCRA